MRLFIAVDIPASNILTELESDLRKMGKGIRSIRSENQHITCKFIGEPPCSLEEIIRTLEEAGSGIDPFRMEASSFGAFPNWKRPSVLWVGFDNEEPLKDLASRIDKVLERSNGIPSEKREFKVHLTVARIRGSFNTHQVREILENGIEALIKEEYEVKVNEFHLYSSELTPNGPIYTMLKTFSLGE